MKRRLCRIAFAFATALAAAAPVCVPRVASAQDDATIQMARERFQEGVKYYDAKQYDKARAAFLQAYALKKHPAVLLNLAQSELRSAHEADAARHFAQYMRENKEASAAERQEAEKGLSTAKAGLGEITVSVDIADADVYVDGNLEGRSPLPAPVYLKPGSHTLEARKEGKTANSNVTALAGQSGSVSLSFAGGGTAPVGVPPAGTGTEAGGPPPGPTGQPPGPMPGGPPGPPPEGDTGGKPGFLEWAAHNKVAWVGAGITVIGLGAGIGFAVASHNSYNDADTIRNKILKEAQNTGTTGGPCDPGQDPSVRQHYASACSTYQQRVNDGDSQKTVATVSFVVAGAAAAGTVIYYFIDTGSHTAKVGKTKRRPRHEGVSATILPMVGPHDGGIGILGQF